MFVFSLRCPFLNYSNVCDHLPKFKILGIEVSLFLRPLICTHCVFDRFLFLLFFFFHSLFGQYSKQDFQWLSVKLNFTSVLNQKCQAGNYTYWSPNDEVPDQNTY